MIRIYFILFLLFGILSSISAQTCCSGGVPVSNNLGFKSTDKGYLQYSFAFNHNQLTSLYSENEELDDDSRLRTTQTFIARGAYQISSKLSAELFVPFIRQTRKINQTAFGTVDVERSNGLGDIILLGNYEVVQSKINWSLTGGIKFATGNNNVTNSGGFLLVNDLQPGSNAIDFIFKTALSGNLSSRPSTSLYGSFTRSFKGTNSSYLGSLSYKFGNETNLIVGVQDQLLLASQIINPGIAFRYRKAGRDLVNSSSLESTGGEWLFTQLNLGWSLNPFSQLALSFELPTYSFVNGTQLSPDYSINLSFYSRFKI